MGRIVDGVSAMLAVFALGFVYFRITLGIVWVAILFALALSLLVGVMLRQLPGRRRAKREKPARRPIRLASRKNAPRCALYGALYMALYLITGGLAYLPLSLALLFLAGMGFKMPGETPPKKADA